MKATTEHGTAGYVSKYTGEPRTGRMKQTLYVLEQQIRHLEPERAFEPHWCWCSRRRHSARPQTTSRLVNSLHNTKKEEGNQREQRHNNAALFLETFLWFHKTKPKHNNRSTTKQKMKHNNKKKYC